MPYLRSREPWILAYKCPTALGDVSRCSERLLKGFGTLLCPPHTLPSPRGGVEREAG